MRNRLFVAALTTVLFGGGAQAGWDTSVPGVVTTADKVRVTTTSGWFGVYPAEAFITSTPPTNYPPTGYQFFAWTNAQQVSSAFQLHSSYSFASTSYVGNFGQYGTVISHNREPQYGGFTDLAASDKTKAAHIVVGDTFDFPNTGGRIFRISNMAADGSENVRFLVKYNGNVGIGVGVEGLLDASNGNQPFLNSKRLVVNGDIHVSGNINAKFQDVAEWVPASEDLPVGAVVVLSPGRENEVMVSTRPYDTAVAGVVSDKPGLLLGEAASTKEMIATTGRVRVKVDATRAPIAVGDLLVTSDRPGYAMRSIPVDVAGIPMHRPGTIVGKALGALASGEGEVLVLLSLQ